MGPFDDFVHISTHPRGERRPAGGIGDEFLENSKGSRQFTEGLIVDSIRRHHPNHLLSISPSYSCDLLAFGRARDDVKLSPHGNLGVKERVFVPPARRYNDENGGAFVEQVKFGCYDYVFKGTQFLLYVVEGPVDFYVSKFNYLLIKEDSDSQSNASPQALSDELMELATEWAQELHNEVLVFDQGYWSKNTELWENIQKSEWEDVILEEEKKEAIIDDVIGFFDGEHRYAEFNVPWKRGVIFYGPPGNGKTISTKALMHQISKRTSPTIEALYVKTFNSFMGPEYGIRQIFLKARQMAPCLLIFEDIDSLVNVSVRSYFLNEVDGLESNHGILMIGSTNHLERLDPGIAKRPSRFDRKYLFDVPTRDERVQYCEYWRNKLKDNKKIDFPKEMSSRVADITGDFSFAYMKEAFVAALLVIVAKSDARAAARSRGDPLSDNILWNEIQRQVENLRREMDDESKDTSTLKTQAENFRGGVKGESQAISPTPQSSLNMRNDVWQSLSAIPRDEERLRPLGPTRPMDIRNNVVPRYM